MGGSPHILRPESIDQLTWSVPSQISVTELFLYPTTRRSRMQVEKVWRVKFLELHAALSLDMLLIKLCAREVVGMRHVKRHQSIR